MAILRPNVGLTALLLANILSAFFAPIQDCDEVFNYWEPVHYLLHGYGLQTWELSPEFSIRSWLYASLHAGLIRLFSLTHISDSKTSQFIFLRVLLAFVNTLVQKNLFDHMRDVIHPRAAWFFLLVCCSSAGNFISSASFLPNSFVMYCMSLAMAAFMNEPAKDSASSCITWIAAASVFGWPFVGLLSLPFAIFSAFQSFVFDNSWLPIQLVKALCSGLVLLAFEVAVDSYFAGHLHSVPFNITLYNVFSSEGRGPELYGTEPWYFYVLNLSLNFNLGFWLALLALPLATVNQRAIYLPNILTYVLLSPFYLWLVAMSLPAHKEERFMYPIYPCLAFNAAVSLQVLADFILKQSAPKGKEKASNWNLISTIDQAVSYVPFRLRRLAFFGLLGITAFVGIWRSLGLATAYDAPFKIYQKLPIDDLNDTNVCVGKEWYRFPSSFFLPSGNTVVNGTFAGTKRLKFVRSSFHGLLPGEFAETGPGAEYSLFPATSIIPAGMNNKNEEDLGKYTDVEQCDYMVDSNLPSWAPNLEEPDYISLAKKEEGWSVIACEPFLDAASTGSLGRIGWAPGSLRIWGEYCLLVQHR
ncbi:MAG: hypothetical protein Q9159_003202 [Coniocarpon cinnabarinum]